MDIAQMDHAMNPQPNPHTNPRPNRHQGPSDPSRNGGSRPGPVSSAIPAQHASRPTAAEATARGSTAVNTTHNKPRHVLGSAARAIRVFAETVFRITVLGSDDAKL